MIGTTDQINLLFVNNFSFYQPTCQQQEYHNFLYNVLLSELLNHWIQIYRK